MCDFMLCLRSLEQLEQITSSTQLGLCSDTVTFGIHTGFTFKELSARQRDVRGSLGSFLSTDSRFLKGDGWGTQCTMLAATMLAATYSIRPERPSSTPESSPGTEPILGCPTVSIVTQARCDLPRVTRQLPPASKLSCPGCEVVIR